MINPECFESFLIKERNEQIGGERDVIEISYDEGCSKENAIKIEWKKREFKNPNKQINKDPLLIKRKKEKTLKMKWNKLSS